MPESEGSKPLIVSTVSQFATYITASMESVLIGNAQAIDLTLAAALSGGQSWSNPYLG